MPQLHNLNISSLNTETNNGIKSGRKQKKIFKNLILNQIKPLFKNQTFVQDPRRSPVVEFVSTTCFLCPHVLFCVHTP